MALLLLLFLFPSGKARGPLSFTARSLPPTHPLCQLACLPACFRPSGRPCISLSSAFPQASEANGFGAKTHRPTRSHNWRRPPRLESVLSIRLSVRLFRTGREKGSQLQPPFSGVIAVARHGMRRPPRENRLSFYLGIKNAPLITRGARARASKRCYVLVIITKTRESVFSSFVSLSGKLGLGDLGRNKREREADRAVC